MKDTETFESIVKENRIITTVYTGPVPAPNWLGQYITETLDLSGHSPEDTRSAVSALKPDLCVVGSETPPETLRAVAEVCDAALWLNCLPPDLRARVGMADDWITADLNMSKGATLFLRKDGRFEDFGLTSFYGHNEQVLLGFERRVSPRAADPMNIVTIMNYADDDKYNLMCMIWMKRVQQFAPGATIHVLTLNGLPPAVQRYFERFQNVNIIQAERRNVGEFDHFNLAVKLYNLASLDFPFIFLDADMFVLSDLTYLWERRLHKPWIGVDDQTTILGISAPFPHLNSGMQVVSDPLFYDYNLIIKCFNDHGRHFLCNGEDQALLFDYFRTIGYDYRHPEINCGWNSCSSYSALHKEDDGTWHGETRNFPEQYPVHVVHYWNGSCRPWHIGCPLFREEAMLFQRASVSYSTERKTQGRASRDPTQPLKVHVMNSPPKLIQKPGNHPFAPLLRTRIESVDSPENADCIFWNLGGGNPKLEYDKLPYNNSELFKTLEERFVLFSAALKPGVLYLNDALSLAAHPIYQRDINRLSNVVGIPYLLDCVDRSLIEDNAFVERCRGQHKTSDIFVFKSLEELVRSGIPNPAQVNLTVENREQSALMSLDPKTRKAAASDILEKLAAAKYYLHFEADHDAPLMLYNALLVGTVPIVAAMPELAFSEFADWSKFAVFPEAAKSITDLVTRDEIEYGNLRSAAMEFADRFCRPACCNEIVIQQYLLPKLEGR